MLSKSGLSLSHQPTILAAAFKAAIRYLVLVAIPYAAIMSVMPGLSGVAASSLTPPPLPAPLVSMGLKDWNGESKPLFSLEQLRGEQGHLSQYRHRIVLVHFFATWCASCHDEIISLQQLNEQVKDQSISILAVDVADLDMRAKRYFENNRVSFPILLDRERETAKAWGVYSLPMTFILDKSLNPKYWVEGSLDWSHPEIASFLYALTNE
ncbi:MAG: TlpA disulfide reductase family protein [Pseudomonadota bacterium]